MNVINVATALLLISFKNYAAEVTEIAEVRGKFAAFVGYDSGEIYFCTINPANACARLQGTPSSNAVTALSTIMSETHLLALAGFKDGSLYRCTNLACAKIK